MYIRSLDLKNFRNYENLSLSLNKGINIFFGDNAQGKTNIIESIYIAGKTKSHRGSFDRDMIKYGEEESHIRVIACRHDIDYRIDVHLKKNKSKGIAVNMMPVKKAGDLFQVVNLVLFSPEDLNIVKDGPSARRKFINLELSQVDKIYYKDLCDYTKCLTQRNALLKNINLKKAVEDELDIWDEQLSYFGKKVSLRRYSFISELNEIIRDIHFRITGGKENLKLCYEPNLSGENFSDILKKNREKDLKYQTTNSGPHRDDVCIMINDRDVRVFGSQGQIRSAALSLKLAEISIIRDKNNDVPVLLLDDVLSELDRQRQKLLLSEINGLQTIITCTGLDDFVNNSFEADKLFNVVNGKVYQK